MINSNLFLIVAQLTFLISFSNLTSASEKSIINHYQFELNNKIFGQCKEIRIIGKQDKKKINKTCQYKFLRSEKPIMCKSVIITELEKDFSIEKYNYKMSCDYEDFNQRKIKAYKKKDKIFFFVTDPRGSIKVKTKIKRKTVPSTALFWWLENIKKDKIGKKLSKIDILDDQSIEVGSVKLLIETKHNSNNLRLIGKIGRLQSIITLNNQNQLLSIEQPGLGLVMKRINKKQHIKLTHNIELENSARFIISPQEMTLVNQPSLNIEISKHPDETIEIPENNRQKVIHKSKNKIIIQTFSSSFSNNLKNFSKPTNKSLSYINDYSKIPINSDIKSKAVSLTKDYKKDFNKVQVLTNWVHENISQTNRETIIINPVNTLIKKSGDCRQLSDLLSQMLISIGIPAKIITGLAAIDGHFSFHSWTEVFITKWIEVDPSLGQIGIDTSHVKLYSAKSYNQPIPSAELLVSKLISSIKQIKIYNTKTYNKNYD